MKTEVGVRRLLRPGAHWVWLSIVMYGVACLLPAMPPIFGDDPIPGWVCLVSVIYTFPAWWANPAYFLSLILYAFRWRRPAAVLAGLAVVLAISYEVMEASHRGFTTLQELQIGCFVWVASTQVLACHLMWEEWLAWCQKRDASIEAAAEPAR